MKKIEYLTGWEMAAIELALEKQVETMHRESLDALLAKLRRASRVRLSYVTVAERNKVLDEMIEASRYAMPVKK